jgi:beta-xylosidase
MDQGASTTNGPHQGAWVSTQTGEDWFLHFQDKEAYGRIVHLQPMKWVNDWPVIGSDRDGDGKGEPVATYKKPNVGKSYPVVTPPDSDEFNGAGLGLQWQWMSNPAATWFFTNPASGRLRLFSGNLPDSTVNLWGAGNVLLQKFPAEEFQVTTKMSFTPNTKLEGEKAGLTVMGLSYAGLALKGTKTGVQLVYLHCKDAGKNAAEKVTPVMAWAGNTIYLRVQVGKGAQCRFGYSADGATYTYVGGTFTAEVGRWKGAKTGLFCTRTTSTNDAGFADFDWFRVEPLK